MNSALLGQARKALAILLVLLFSVVIFPTPTFAQAFNDVATIENFEHIFSRTISAALGLGGVILFIMFIIGGFKYLTAQGDPKAVESAKGTLSHAVIGLIVLVLALVILSIIQTITGAPVTDFDVRR